MNNIFVTYYDENDNPKSAYCLWINFDNGVARFRNQNDELIEIDAKRLDRITAA